MAGAVRGCLGPDPRQCALCPQREAHPPRLRPVLQHLGVEAEVEAHTFSAAFFVARGDGAELAVPGLPAPVPALNLGGEAQEVGSGAAATPARPRLPVPGGSAEAALTCSPVSGLITASWSKLNAPFSSCGRVRTWGK